MSRILVTGGAGFIASELAEKLSHKKEDEIVVVDNLQTGMRIKVPEGMYQNIKFIKCDVNIFKDISAVFFAYKFDYVFHYAATVGVRRTLENPVKVLDDINGIRNILDLSKNTGVSRVFFSSSSEVYGEPVEIPQNEDTTPLNSKLPYAIVKNIGEAFLRSYQVEYDLNYTIFRFFNTYGVKQSPDFVISKFIRSALQGHDLTVFGEGDQTRTFCFVDDNTDAVLGAFYGNECVNDVMNVGSNVEMNILELAKTIIEITGSKSKITHLPPLKEGDMTRRMPDNSKMMSILGRDLLPLHAGISKILENTSYILS
ncbi:NAD-dependent epimerase/dehydratase family protein [Cryomorpha ignava]|uniref:NAD-dependent epimerase/dehydratase family protein n=1 Tax=Cryomorpha ignava TaxID=101383 RepID=A0A7K3WTQ9_9FLAO|nr:NAD-dependent epimerase/dehydratase family protein [Cryomorpha ignava]NEN24045.1 NAD-dependent epimerase/dehydratase family protein [Cryomorpha ignava]